MRPAAISAKRSIGSVLTAIGYGNNRTALKIAALQK